MFCVTNLIHARCRGQAPDTFGNSTALNFRRRVSLIVANWDLPRLGRSSPVKARSIGREEPKADRGADTPRLQQEPVTAPVTLLGRHIRLLPNPDGELRAADGDRLADPKAVRRHLAKASGEHLGEARAAMAELAGRHEPAELNRIGFRLYGLTTRFVQNRTLRGEAHLITPLNKGFRCRLPLNMILKEGFER